MRKNIKVSILILITFMLLFCNTTKVFASFADFTDEEADKKAEQQMEEQQKQNNQIDVKSNNNYLKELNVKGYNLTPEFDKQTINYEISEEINVDSIDIIAKTDDEKSSVSGDGKVQLNSGENNLRIDVTAESGTVRTYFLKVKKIVKEQIILNDLKLKAYSKENEVYDIKLTPEFDKNIFEYNCNVSSYIDKIEVEANLSDNNAKVEIAGNENLQEGLNEIMISISFENEKTIYKIKADKEQKIKYVEKQSINYNNIIIAILIIVIILLCICFIKRNTYKTKH